MLPEYGRRSLAEVLPSLLAALGVGGAPALPVEPARAAALLLVDGLGSELLREHAADAPFLASLPDAGPLTVGFPSSTVVSLASVGTGLPPGSHGMVGTSFEVDGTRLDGLNWRADADPAPERVQPAPTVFERAGAAGVAVTVVSRRVFRDTPLTRAVLRGGEYRGNRALGDLAAEMITALTAPGRRLVYGYHADLDTMGHVYGPGSLPWRVQLAQVDRLVATLANALPADAVLAVTGDHGMVTMDRTFDVDTVPELRAGVRLLAGDPRSRHVYAEPGAAASVLAAWREVLGDAAVVVPREQAVEEGWFGPVAAAFAGRIGDVVVAARDGAGVIRSVAEPAVSSAVGQHGSLSAAELLVPFLLTRV
ncbi:alkaline phosphatase family protein [Actinophytocola gossypii]|uniref:Alkaline phosphatase family protein n=1 Tax=Actinophytocola gossypii TaxID=2812003 RepID=A0ABT2J918_9PSEU|nr:nucleotide pyrophosphatase/phosphodiesterase family protein [Actinophytocola gossypii]MCT2584361.1 alkaline phosphatase family protein [Actinophytocola gossypii]